NRRLDRRTTRNAGDAGRDDRYRLAASSTAKRAGCAMNGVHDMGGMQDFGPVVPEADEPRFHHGWERRVFGLTIAMGATGAWNLDQSRAARESLPPAQYLASSYYEIWLAGMQAL